MSNNNFEKLIEKLRAKYPGKNNNLARGKAFEPICKWALENEPIYKNLYKKVWLWDDWPGKWDRDKGIDIIAEDHQGLFTAIQVKFHSQLVPRNDISDFLAESSRSEITYRLLISVSGVSKNAEENIKNQEKKCATIYKDRMEDFKIDWLDSLNQEKEFVPKKFDAEPHQKEALEKITQNFQLHDRGKVIMACGTGKTLVGLWASENLDSEKILVFVPTLALVQQLADQWNIHTNKEFLSMFVCSDQTADKDVYINHPEQIGLPITTDSEKISTFLKSPGKRVIFSTYQSSKKISLAQSKFGAPKFDLVICDEAHHCAGKIDRDFSRVLKNNGISANKRLFMTATPRITRATSDKDHLTVTSMDDKNFFGDDFYTLTFGQAIKDGLLADYEVVIQLVTDKEIRKKINQRENISLENSDFNDIDAETLATLASLIKTIDKYSLKKILTFHNKIEQAKYFSKYLQELYLQKFLNPNLEPKFIKHIQAKGMTVSKRTQIISDFRKLDNNNTGIISNAKCLNEGVDVKEIDCVAFIEPKESQIDIVQAVGRAIRPKNQSDKKGIIYIPVFVDENVDVEENISSTRFKKIWDVLKAIRDHDNVLEEELNQIRFEKGRRPGISRKKPKKITIEWPKTIVGNEFFQALETKIVDHLVDYLTPSWEFMAGLLYEYKDKYGHCNVPQKYKDEYALGAWVSTQRIYYNKGELIPERIEKLKKLGFVWDPLEAEWQNGFKHLSEYKEQYGHCNVPYKFTSEDGFNLGYWVNFNRRRKDKLSTERIEKLEKLGFIWTPKDEEDNAKWENGFDHLSEYKKQYGHCNVSSRFTSKDGYLLGAWVHTQKRSRKTNKLSPERFERLEKLGFIWTSKDEEDNAKWENGFDHLSEYKKQHGHCNVSSRFTSKDGFYLGDWVRRQRISYKKNELIPERFEKLEKLGFTWSIKDVKWQNSFKHLTEYKKQYGHCNVPGKFKSKDGYRLGAWVNKQRIYHKKNELILERFERLEKSGFIWSIKDVEDNAKWENGFSHLTEYKKQYGHCNVSGKFKSKDGFYLGDWVRRQKISHKTNKLIPERIEKLEKSGFIWSTNTNQKD